jgi:hypothetical protein
MTNRTKVTTAACALLLAACAPVRPPSPPRAEANVPFYDFVNSFQLSVETNADKLMLSPSVWRLRNSNDASQVAAGFDDWCKANKGTPTDTTYAPMKTAADGYLEARLQEHPSSAGGRLYIHGYACLTGDEPIAGVINLYDSNLAFYDKAQLAVFLGKYWEPKRASYEEDQSRKREAEAKQKEAEARWKAEAPERERVAREAAERERRAAEVVQAATQAFRRHLSVGDETHCGLVVEVKPPIAKIQTADGEKWLKIAQVYPQGMAPCRFFNHVYVEP